MSTFLVSGMGRSGTTFLSVMLNRAEGWDVKHEPDQAMMWQFAKHRFAIKSNYGEVNSFLLLAMPHIQVDTVAVILRDPFQILASMLRTGYQLKGATYLILQAITHLNHLVLEYDVYPIYFPRLVHDPEYLIQVAQFLGVTTLREEQVDCSLVLNASNKLLPIDTHLWLAKEHSREFHWFKEKYEL